MTKGPLVTSEESRESNKRERRERIATAIAQGLVASWPVHLIPETAIEIADALIRELDK